MVAKLLTIGKETKTLAAWGRDKRCEVHPETFKKRLRQGVSPQEAMKRVKYVKHGLYYHNLYHRWKLIKSRCHCKTDKQYPDYGGRGIKVCKAWRNDITAFYKWAMSNGYRKDLCIDRIDNNKGYSPSNCRWVTHQINNNNKRDNVLLTVFGEVKTITDWSRDRRCVCPVETLRTRLYQLGMTPKDALTTPVRKGLLFTAFGKTKTVADWSRDKRCRVNLRTLASRLLQYHWEVEKALTKPTRNRGR